MWKTILSNINNLILANWKSLFYFGLGIAAGVFLFSCTAVNSAVDWTQDVTGNAVDWTQETTGNAVDWTQDVTGNAVDWTQEAGTDAVDWVTGADAETEE